MFYTPKPRQFHYAPRFYDPEKEQWEMMKKKYAIKKEMEEKMQADSSSNSDLAYFEQKVRDLDREEQKRSSRLGWKDLFRKREMPKFNYQSRLQGEGQQEVASSMRGQKRIKFSRRFDVEDPDSYQPVSAGKIFLYIGLVCLLLYWILF